MMPILVKSDDVRSGRKPKARDGRLRAEQESIWVKADGQLILLLKLLYYSESILTFTGSDVSAAASPVESKVSDK